MKISKNVDFSKVNGTSLQGRVIVGYSKLVELFGAPLGGYDDYKSDAEWVLEFTDEDGNSEVATIYNWKNGRNYLGPNGLPVEEIRDWNIGGRSTRVEALVRNAIFRGIKAV